MANDSEDYDMANVTKMSVNVPDKLFEALKAYADLKGISMTEALRRAISLHKFIDEQLEQSSKLLIETKDKQVREVVMPY